MPLDGVVEHAHPLFDCDNDCRFCGKWLLDKFVMEAGDKIHPMREIPEPKGLKRKGGGPLTQRWTQKTQNLISNLEQVHF